MVVIHRIYHEGSDLQRTLPLQKLNEGVDVEGEPIQRWILLIKTQKFQVLLPAGHQPHLRFVLLGFGQLVDRLHVPEFDHCAVFILFIPVHLKQNLLLSQFECSLQLGRRHTHVVVDGLVLSSQDLLVLLNVRQPPSDYQIWLVLVTAKRSAWEEYIPC